MPEENQVSAGTGGVGNGYTMIWVSTEIIKFVTSLPPQSTSSAIGLIILDEKFLGKRSAGNPHAAFEVAGTGNVAWSRYGDTHRRKGEITVNTNFDLNWRA